MSIRDRHILMATSAIVVVAIFILAIVAANALSKEPAADETMIQTKSFSISSDSVEVNTSAKGSILVRGVDGVPTHVRIVAMISIDPEDWGGVFFYIPGGWSVSDVMSSYPENRSKAQPPEYYVTTALLAGADSSYEWGAEVRIGDFGHFDNGVPIATGGGEGTVVFDLVPDEDARLEAFKIGIAVGSDIRNGHNIMGDDHITIMMPLA